MNVIEIGAGAYERMFRSEAFNEIAEFDAGNSAGASSRKALSRDNDGASDSAMLLLKHYLDPCFVAGTRFVDQSEELQSVARGENFPYTPELGPKPSWGAGQSPALSRALPASGIVAGGAGSPSLDFLLKNNRHKPLSVWSAAGVYAQPRTDCERNERGDLVPMGRGRFCGRLSLIGVDGKKGKKVYRRLNCGSWTCSYCGPRRVKAARSAICKVAAGIGLNHFLTLTLDPNKVPNMAWAAKYIRQTWNKFREYLKRKFGISPKYISVLEFTKAGVPHLHILIDRYISQRWISAVWGSLGGGRVVDIRLVTPAKIAAYVSKYLSKELLISAPKGTRRITTARGIKLFPKSSSSIRWRMVKASIWSLVKRKRARAAKRMLDKSKDAAGPLFAPAWASTVGCDRWWGELDVDRKFRFEFDSEEFLNGFSLALRKEAAGKV